jgi:vacuolar-type H+-ATPase subunit C/Vma6
MLTVSFLIFLPFFIRCETLDDVRLNLSETDYSTCLADSSTMTPASLQKAAIEKVSLNASLVVK